MRADKREGRMSEEQWTVVVTKDTRAKEEFAWEAKLLEHELEVNGKTPGTAIVALAGEVEEYLQAAGEGAVPALEELPGEEEHTAQRRAKVRVIDVTRVYRRELERMNTALERQGARARVGKVLSQ